MGDLTTRERRSCSPAAERTLQQGLPAARRRAQATTRRHADAEDAVSIAAARYIAAVEAGRLTAESNHIGYLVTAVRSAAIDLSRAAAHQRTLASHDRTDRSHAPDDIAVITDDALEAREILNRLPDRQTAALVLVHAHGYSHAEAGRSLGINANAVAQLLHRARRGFRLAWAARVAGPPTSGHCDQAVLDLFSTRVNDHQATCARCGAVRESFEERTLSL